MRRFRTLAIAVVLFAAAAPARSETPVPPVLEVLGTVTNAARPVANALVIALNLQDFAASQAWTASDGTFNLPTLRGGIYKIIAVKQGFIPAIQTLVPTGAKHKLALKLENEGKQRKSSANQEIWELRGSLPPDVLRDLDNVLRPAEIASYEVPRFRGEMLSLTGLVNQAADPAFAQTALGVHGRIGDNWQVGISGNMQRFEDATDGISFGTPLAESSVMSMELRSSPTQSYRVASTKSSWRYVDAEREGGGLADVRAHNFEWQSGPSKVEVRYFQQENLFNDASNVIEIAGESTILQTRRNDLGVSLRVTQETVGSTSDALRVADLTANGSVSVVPSLILHYGMTSRLRVDGQDWAPRTGAEWKITENTSIVGSGLYKIIDHDATRFTLPSLVFWTEDTRVLPRYLYTFGVVHDVDGKSRLSAIATVSETDEPLRMVFGDGYDQFWDGLYIDAGDIRKDVRVAYRKEFGNRLAIDVATSAGTAENHDLTDPNVGTKTYVTGDLQSTFSPTRTTLAVSYREIQQPRDDQEEDYRTERINVRMAQSLYLPVDLKLLIGVELARAENSPYLIDTLTPQGRSKKYLGGLALNF